MFARRLIVGTIGLIAVPALSLAGSVDSSQFRTITVQPGQGAAITLQVPNTPNADVTPAPYALTGRDDAVTATRLVPMRLGQGEIVWVQVAN